MSEKRKGFLLLLQDGAKEMEYLLKSLDATRQALLPQIKVLEEHHLVDHYDDTYELTTIGKLIVDEMTLLLKTIDTFDADIDYWGTHNLNFIPSHLLERISEIGRCKIITPPVIDVYALNKKILETSVISKSHYTLATFYHPAFSDFFANLISNNVSAYFLVSQGVLDKLRIEHPADFEKIIKSKLHHFFVYPKNIDLMALVFNDYYILIRPLKNTGEFDTKHILCNNREAIKWGKELFEYYLKDSIPITEI
jgi:predicted transcriptional regulator